MATLTWVYQGLQDANKLLLNNMAGFNWKLRLYTNNHAVAIGDLAAALTECALAGYAAVTTVAANWVFAQQVGYYSATYPATTFAFNAYAGGTTIFGFYITDGAGLLLLGGLLDTSFAVPAGGGSLTINLEIDTIQF